MIRISMFVKKNIKLYLFFLLIGVLLGLLYFKESHKKYEKNILINVGLYQGKVVEPGSIFVKRVNSNYFITSLFLASGKSTLINLVEINPNGNKLKPSIKLIAKFDKINNVIDLKVISDSPATSSDAIDAIFRDLNSRFELITLPSISVLTSRKIELQSKLDAAKGKTDLLICLSNEESIIFKLNQILTYPMYVKPLISYRDERAIGKSMSDLLSFLIISIFLNLICATFVALKKRN